MGLFNSLFVDRRCPECGAASNREIQFRFGDTGQHNFRVGDVLGWDGNDKGERGLARARVLGWLSECPNCGADEGDCAVLLEHDRLVGFADWVGPIPELSRDTWYVIEDLAGGGE